MNSDWQSDIDICINPDMTATSGVNLELLHPCIAQAWTKDDLPFSEKWVVFFEQYSYWNQHSYTGCYK